MVEGSAGDDHSSKQGHPVIPYESQVGEASPRGVVLSSNLATLVGMLCLLTTLIACIGYYLAHSRDFDNYVPEDGRCRSAGPLGGGRSGNTSRQAQKTTAGPLLPVAMFICACAVACASSESTPGAAKIGTTTSAERIHRGTVLL